LDDAAVARVAKKEECFFIFMCAMFCELCAMSFRRRNHRLNVISRSTPFPIHDALRGLNNLQALAQLRIDAL
jgi:hypothetical protein